MTQCEKILNFLEENGTITQREALRYCGVMRLASRVHDLRKSGYNIISETITVVNRDESTSSVARYRLGDAGCLL